MGCFPARVAPPPITERVANRRRILEDADDSLWRARTVLEDGGGLARAASPIASAANSLLSLDEDADMAVRVFFSDRGGGSEHVALYACRAQAIRFAAHLIRMSDEADDSGVLQRGWVDAVADFIEESDESLATEFRNAMSPRCIDHTFPKK